MPLVRADQPCLGLVLTNTILLVGRPLQSEALLRIVCDRSLDLGYRGLERLYARPLKLWVLPPDMSVSICRDRKQYRVRQRGRQMITHDLVQPGEPFPVQLHARSLCLVTQQSRQRLGENHISVPAAIAVAPPSALATTAAAATSARRWRLNVVQICHGSGTYRLWRFL